MNKIVSATGEGKLPLVSTDDVAAVGFHALTSQDFPMRDLVILGPELLSYDDVANIISKVVGRTITHVHLSPEQLHNQMIMDGFPRAWAMIASEMQESTSKGSEENLNDVILQVTGKHLKKFVDFVEVKFVWENEVLKQQCLV
ncbi:hypothetical protein OCU04_000166 [Sclerotinia nivalis]|uniref:NmrA-like domain-containing protein n=1 Tax=Sclerotinia nivalis TaxID=352851 RepID=A0A9X0AVJ3_9HELO|nr:hypothetical protein OCU04_000166 [Sclerotinia nivalis]